MARRRPSDLFVFGLGEKSSVLWFGFVARRAFVRFLASDGVTGGCLWARLGFEFLAFLLRRLWRIGLKGRGCHETWR